jgi:hypothetical protein
MRSSLDREKQEGRTVVVKHLNQIELSRRWSLSPRTLERWRWLRQGPDYLKIMGRVVYRLEDIERFETEVLRRIVRGRP